MYNFPPENPALRKLAPKHSKRTAVEIIERIVRHGKYRSFQYDAYRFDNTYYICVTTRELNAYRFHAEPGCFIHDRYGYHLVNEVTFAHWPKFLIVTTTAVAADVFYQNIDQKQAVWIERGYPAISKP